MEDDHSPTTIRKSQAIVATTLDGKYDRELFQTCIPLSSQVFSGENLAEPG